MPHDLTTEHVPVADLRAYYRNPRQGNTAAIAASLKVNGQYRTLCANRGTHTGRPNEVLAGNHTLAAARDLAWDTVAVAWVDVDEDQAARIVAADNRTADLGGYDNRLLVEMLAELPDLDGTGYDPGDFDDLRAALEEAAANPVGPGDDGPSADDNVTHRSTLDEKYANYETDDQRQIVLAYKGEQYIWVVEMLSALGATYGVESNAATLLKLIEAATNEHAPGGDT